MIKNLNSLNILYRRRACGDLRSVPEPDRPREQVKKHGRACTQVLFLCKAELGLFHFLENSDKLAGTFRWSEDPSRAWLVPSS